MSILLKEDYILEKTPNLYGDLEDALTLVKASSTYTVKYLEEPCTEHGTYLFHLKPQPLHSHRFDCPDCMANIKKELGL